MLNFENMYLENLNEFGPSLAEIDLKDKMERIVTEGIVLKPQECIKSILYCGLCIDDLSLFYDYLDLIFKNKSANDIGFVLYKVLKEVNYGILTQWPLDNIQQFASSEYCEYIIKRVAFHHTDIFFQNALFLSSFPWFKEIAKSLLSEVSINLKVLIRFQEEILPQINNLDLVNEIKFALNERLERTLSVRTSNNLLSTQLNPRPEKALEDPAVTAGVFLSIQSGLKMPQWYKNTTENVYAMTLMIARNLYFRNKFSSIKNIQAEAEVDQIKTIRDKHCDLAIFKDRFVYLLAQQEFDKDNNLRFGNQKLRDMISSFSNKGLNYDIADNARIDLLEKFEAVSSPITFIFNGHGSPKYLCLNNGNVIWVKDMVKLIELRQKFTTLSNPDIYIITSCNSHTFIRNIYDRLIEMKFKLPIMISTSEYGQLGFTNYRIDGNNDLFGNFPKKVKSGETIKLSDLYDMNTLNSKPCIYAPDDQNNLSQIS